MNRSLVFLTSLALLAVTLAFRPLALTPTHDPEPTKIKWLTIEQAYALNQKEPRKMVIDVYTDWCGWCKVMDRETFSKPAIAEFVNKNYYAVKLNAEQIREYEPHVKGVEGMFVPQTGIVDYRVVSEKMAAKFQKLGGSILYGEKVTGITKGNTLTIVKTEHNVYETKLVINCAGLYSDKVAQMSQG